MNNQIINHIGSHLEKPKELEEDSTTEKEKSYYLF